MYRPLPDTLNNLYKIEMYGQAERGYSGDGIEYGDRRYSHDNSYGNSYDGRKDMMNKLDKLMGDAPTEKDREAIRRCMDLMRDMSKIPADFGQREFLTPILTPTFKVFQCIFMMFAEISLKFSKTKRAPQITQNT